VDSELQLPFEVVPSVEETEGVSHAEREALRREEAHWWIARIREELGPGVRRHTAREPCPACNVTVAVIQGKGLQDAVRCARCGRHLYNAPRTETGRRVRTVDTVRRNIKPGQQARVLERDQGRCLLCRRADQALTIGHLLSVEEGFALGASEAELSDDADLAAMCEACNLGLGGLSVSPRTYAVMLWLVRAEIHRRQQSR